MSCFKADILIINESKLDSTFRYNELYLSGFEIVRRDRLRIRDDLNINDNLQCLFVEISMPRSTGFMVRTKYRPPGTPIELFNGFEKLTLKIMSCIYSAMLTAICCLRQNAYRFMHN